jgi:hypothetical protein
MQSGFTNIDPPKSKYSAFGTFLETLREGEEPVSGSIAQQAPAPSEGPAFQPLAPSAAGAAPAQAPSHQVLEYLARNGAQPAGKVVEDLHVGILEFGDVLKALVEAGLVEVERTGASEILALTKLGNTVMSLP